MNPPPLLAPWPAICTLPLCSEHPSTPRPPPPPPPPPGYGFTNAMMLQSSYAVMGASLAIAFLATSASLPADKKE